MRVLLRSLCLASLLFTMGLNVAAQNAPEPINAAYADLSSRLGVTLNTGNTNWRWEQTVFGDTSLGCPQEGQVYTQQQVVGYIFTIISGGITYDYRVSADQQIVVLCRQVAEDEAVPDPSDEPPYSNPLCPAPADPFNPFLRTRVVVDGAARSVGGSNLRTEADVDAAIVERIPAQAVFTITGGPSCNAEDASVWWFVDYDGLTGWTAETYLGDYLIEPFPARALPARQPVTALNAAQLAEVSRLEGNFGTGFAFSPDGAQLAIAGGRGSEGLWLVNLVQVDQRPRYLDRDIRVTHLDYHPVGDRVLAGGVDGGVYLWDVRPDATLIERLYLNTHERDNSGAVMHPDGLSFASSGVNAATTATEQRANAVLLWDLETVSQRGVYTAATDLVTSLSFSARGDALAVIDLTGTLHLYLTPTSALPAFTLEEGVRAVAFSPNSQFMAVGLADGRVLLYSYALPAPQLLATLSGHLRGVNDLAFSPDSALLASLGEDGTLRLWSTQADEALTVFDLLDAARFVRVRFNPDGALIAISADDNTVRLLAVQAP